MEKTGILCPNCMESYLVKTHGDDDEVYCTGCELILIKTGENTVKYPNKN